VGFFVTTAAIAFSRLLPAFICAATRL
jgi:hypothetical protein